MTPNPARSSAAHRDRKLQRVRRLSSWIAGAAVAASLGLGTAFAHALPGHGQPAMSPTTTSGSRSGTHGHAGPPPAGHGGSHHRQLAAPHHRPAPAPAHSQPVVSSGGS